VILHFIKSNYYSQLNHTNLVKIYGITIGPLRMVLELIKGDPLHKILYNTKIDIPKIVQYKIFLDIAKGLNALHTMNPPITHRDLRTPNIFIDSLDPRSSRNAVIGDFGLSHFVVPTIYQVLPTWQSLAPEVIDFFKPRHYDQRSDLYSLGIIYNEVLSKVYPFSEFEEYIEHEENLLSDEYINNPQILQALEKDGYEIDIPNKKAKRDNYQRHKIIEEIVVNDLRPTIPDNIDPAIESIIRRCFLKDPQLRPSLPEIICVIESLIPLIENRGLTISRHRKT